MPRKRSRSHSPNTKTNKTNKLGSRTKSVSPIKKYKLTELDKWKFIINYLLRNNLIELNEYGVYVQNKIIPEDVLDLKKYIKDLIISKFYYRDPSHDTYVLWFDKYLYSFSNNYLILGTNHPFIFNYYGIIQCSENGYLKNNRDAHKVCSIEKINRTNKKRLDKIRSYEQYNEVLDKNQKNRLKYKSLLEFLQIRKWYHNYHLLENPNKRAETYERIFLDSEAEAVFLCKLHLSDYVPHKLTDYQNKYIETLKYRDFI